MYLVAVREPLIEIGEETFICEEVLTHLQRLRDAMDGCVGAITLLAPLGTKCHAIDRENLVPFVAHEHGLRYVIASRWTSNDANESPIASAAYATSLSQLLKSAMIVEIDWRDLACWGSSPPNLDTVRDSGIPLLVSQREARAHSACHARVGSQSVRSRIETPREKVVRQILAYADLNLFESQELLRRYGPYCRNARLIRSGGFTRGQVISSAILDQRSRLLNQSDPIRIAFVDFLNEVNGIHHAVTIVSQALALGANLTLQICNDGPERQVVRYQLAKASLEKFIELKPLPPTSAMMRETLENSHVLLRTPLADVDDRSAFMGFAAGLPMISYDESMALTHAVENQSVVLLPNLCIDTASRRLLELDQNRDWLCVKSLLAREAGLAYSIENAYRRQAEHIMRLIDSKPTFQGNGNRAQNAERLSREFAASTGEI